MGIDNPAQFSKYIFHFGENWKRADSMGKSEKIKQGIFDMNDSIANFGYMFIKHCNSGV